MNRSVLKAFPAAVQPECFFPSQTHMNALAGVLYAAAHRVPLAVVSGPSGAGKTALLAAAEWRVAELRAPISVLRYADPFPSPSSLLAALAQRFAAAGELRKALAQFHQRGITPLLLLDDAHRLDPATIEQVRAITDWTRGEDALLPIVLAGPPGLEDTLSLSLRQMLDVSMAIVALSVGEAIDYIGFRWRRAGLGDLVFSQAALRAVADASEGLPRNIHRICRDALRQARAAGCATVEAEWISRRPHRPPRRVRSERVVALAQAGGA